MKAVQITHAPPGAWVGVEYSSVCPFNADNSRILVIAEDHFILLDQNGAFVMDLPINASQEPRWDRVNPQLIWYVSGNALCTLYLGADNPGVWKVFQEYTTIRGKGESDISPDGHHFVFTGSRLDGTEQVFIYSLVDGKGIVFPQREAFDGLKIDSKNRALLSDHNGIRLLGYWDLTKANGHACPARYQDRDVLLWFNSNENPITVPEYKNGVVMVDIETGAQRGLISFPQKNAKGDGWAYSLHISSCDLPFCLVSAYAPDGSLPCQLWKVPLDGSPVKLSGETDGVIRDYTSQPKASLSRDGSRAVFNVDDGQSVNVWMVHLTDAAKVTETRIDYSGYAGKSEFVMRPRHDGAVDIFERKLG